MDAALAAAPAARQRVVLDRVLARQLPAEKLRAGVLDMWASLANLESNGFSPATIIDGGAFIGEWSRRVRQIFPGAALLMLEANPEKREVLASVAATLGNASLRMSLLGPEARSDVPFKIVEGGPGSSVLDERTSFPRTTVPMTMTTLDSVVGAAGVRGPFLLKLDVQGYEVEVLKGGARTLAQAEAVLLEVSLLQYNEGAPLFAEVVEYMKGAGFVAYDICGQVRRETDGALFQVDILFVPERSALRASKAFWQHEPQPAQPGTAATGLHPPGGPRAG